MLKSSAVLDQVLSYRSRSLIGTCKIRPDTLLLTVLPILCFSFVFQRVVCAQTPPPPPPPPGSWTPGPEVLPHTIPVPQPKNVPPTSGPPVTVVPPPPPPPFPVQDPGVVYPGADPFAFRPPRPPGWFSAFEIGLVVPEITGSLRAPVSVGGFTRPVSVPYADLDWTGSPKLELGYRFAENSGSFLAAYRSVVSEGAESLPRFNPFGGAFLKTRLNLNAVDLMYAGSEMPIAPLWELKWNVGVRIAALYYDSRATGSVISRRVSNNFVGAGPRFGLDVQRYCDAAPGLAFFGRLETAVVIGGDQQSFEEVISIGGATLGGATRFSETEAAPMFGLQLGLSYAPPQNPNWVRFLFGYQFEQWWGVGDAGASTGDVHFQGLFFRGEFRY